VRPRVRRGPRPAAERPSRAPPPRAVLRRPFRDAGLVHWSARVCPLPLGPPGRPQGEGTDEVRRRGRGEACFRRVGSIAGALVHRRVRLRRAREPGRGVAGGVCGQQRDQPERRSATVKRAVGGTQATGRFGRRGEQTPWEPVIERAGMCEPAPRDGRELGNCPWPPSALPLPTLDLLPGPLSLLLSAPSLPPLVPAPAGTRPLSSSPSASCSPAVPAGHEAAAPTLAVARGPRLRRIRDRAGEWGT
jgi:hypothetical protein